jgi:hypothetical protein
MKSTPVRVFPALLVLLLLSAPMALPTAEASTEPSALRYRLAVLPELVDGEGWVIDSITGINERGETVGAGTFEGVRHAVLLTPEEL